MFKFEQSLKTGISFGLTSGIITTLGLIVGLSSSTNSKTVVFGGILIIAITDAVSDALGIHMSEESKVKNTHREIWLSTIFTFFAKFIFALTFIVPVLLFNLSVAVTVSIFWGLFLLGVFSVYIARERKTKARNVVFEHLTLAVAVVFLTNYIGRWINHYFSGT